MQILAQLGDIIEGQAYMKAMLLGGTYREILHAGRLPVLDTQIELIRAEAKLLEKRTASLEDDRIRWKTAIRTASVIAGIVGAVSGTVATIAVDLLMRH
jgi:hypothetical protein